MNKVNGQCLFTGCGREAACRGLCPNHYRQAHKLVSDGKVTWVKLEKNGKSTPARKHGVTEAFFMEGIK